MKKRVLLMGFALLFMVLANAQDGFVALSDYDAATQSTYSVGQVFTQGFTNAGYASEGLQQSFLYRGNDTLLYHNADYPLTYRQASRNPQHYNYILNQGATTSPMYLLPTYGIDSLMNAMAYGVTIPNDTTATAPYNVASYHIPLFDPLVLPAGSVPPVAYNNDAPDEYIVGTTTPVQWLFTVANRSLLDTQLVTIDFPACGGSFYAYDADSIQYGTVRLGPYCWTKENIRSVRYADSVLIPNPMAYGNNVANVERFGYLYTWSDAVRAPLAPDTNGYVQGVCPAGWRVPTIDEFEYLSRYPAADLMATTDWLNNVGNNSTGFTALPAGLFTTLRFENLYGETNFWSVTSTESGMASYCSLTFGCSESLFQNASIATGKSVRCLKN